MLEFLGRNRYYLGDLHERATFLHAPQHGGPVTYGTAEEWPISAPLPETILSVYDMGDGTVSLVSYWGFPLIATWEGIFVDARPLAPSALTDAHRFRLFNLYFPLPTSIEVASSGLYLSLNGLSTDSTPIFGIMTILPSLAILRSGPSEEELDLSHLYLPEVDLTNFGLPQANFTKTDLTGADLTGATLTDAVLSGAKLDSAILQGATLDNATLTGASLTGTDLSGVDLRHIQVGSERPVFSTDPNRPTLLVNAQLDLKLLANDWSNLDLTGAKLDGLEQKPDLSNLKAVCLRAGQLNFKGCNLKLADFSNSVLDQCTFEDAKLGGVVFSGASLKNVDFSVASAINANFGPGNSATKFDDVDFTGANLTDANFAKAVFTNSKFNNSNLKNANFSDCSLGAESQGEATSFSNAFMTNVDFSGANLFYVDFSETTLYGAETKLINTQTMQQAIFSNAYLIEVDLTKANLRGANFDGACLVQANLSDADFSAGSDSVGAAILTSTALQGAIFSEKTNLRGANLTNAGFDLQCGSFQVQHRNACGEVVPIPPENVRYKANEINLDAVFSDDTICPNGFEYRSVNGHKVSEILTGKNSPTSWAPRSSSLGTQRIV